MEPVRHALVGCGMMGARHLRGYGELHRVAPGTLDLLAVCDPNQEYANAVADEAVELLGKRPAVVASIDDLLAVDGLEAVDVVTPNRSHDAIVVPLLEAGLHVLCEKPFAVTIERGRKMIDAVRGPKQVLAVAENNRRDPMNRLSKAIVEAGLLGQLNTVIQVGIAPGGSVIGTPWRHHLAMGGLPLDVWIHTGYILEFIAGNLASVDAGGGLARTEVTWKGPDGEEQVPCEGIDHINALLRFENGAGGTWATHFASGGYGRGELTLIGDEATLHVPGSRGGSPVQLRVGKELIEGDALLERVPGYALPPIETALFGERPASYQLASPETDRKLLAAEVADFAEAIREGRPAEVPAELGLRSVAVIHAFLESIEAGAPVTLDDVLSGAVHAYQDQVEAAG